MRLIRALPYDFEAMIENERKKFGSYTRPLNIETLEKLYNHNQYMFYVVKDGEGNIFGVAVLAPITKEGYDKFINGQASDLCDLELNNIVTRDQEPSDYFLLESIATNMSKGEPYYEATTIAMLRGVIELLKNTKYIVTSPITDEGRSIARTMGFVPVANDLHNNQEIWELKVDEKKQEEVSQRYR